MRIIIAIGLGALPLPVLAQSTPAPGRVQLSIDWDAVRRTQATDHARSLTAIQALGISAVSLDAIKLPVLVPSAEAVRASGRVKGQGSSYSATYNLPAAQLSVMGSGMGIGIHSDSPFALRLEQDNSAAEELVFERSGDGADLSFTRFGASYTLRLSCTNAGDPRCTEEAFLRSVANSLVVVGGSPK
jgi:hypothetical protein